MMKQLYTFFVVLFATNFLFSQNVSINEINYFGSDAGVEIIGNASTNVQDYTLYFYEGTHRKVYKTFTLSGVIPNIENGIGVLWFSITSISEGHPKGAGIALVNPKGELVEFISYAGSFEAKDGPAEGIESENIGMDVTIKNNGKSFQKMNPNWVGPIGSTPGALNTNRTLSVVKNDIEGFTTYPNPVTNGSFKIKSANNTEKNIEIYNLVGALVFSKTVNIEETISVSNLTNGIYLLKVEEEGKIATRKLVVK